MNHSDTTTQTLLQKALAFDLHDMQSEYGFATRLAAENHWTINFTNTAILEYKKFMYLAAVSDFMVSPSGIIDTVWHQHLIFTQSYNEFCQLLGKQIQHIPSTHNKSEFQRFKQAKERTNKLYRETFGQQPGIIWDNEEMFNMLGLPKANYKIRTIIIIALLSLAILFIPLAYLLKPLYIKINNPYFIIGYALIAITTFIILYVHNKKVLHNTISNVNTNSFIHDLHPLELMFLRTQSLENVVHVIMDRLIMQNKMIINEDKTLTPSGDGNYKTTEEFAIMNTLSNYKTIDYRILLPALLTKPAIANIASSMNALKKYFLKSKVFVRLFTVNLITLFILIAFALARMTTGILRDKPFELILIVVIVMMAGTGFFLQLLTAFTTNKIIPSLYRNEPVLRKEETADREYWQYFLYDSLILSAAFIPVYSLTQRTSSNDYSTSSSSSCGSSCGSSCSSCGGCGGD